MLQPSAKSDVRRDAIASDAMMVRYRESTRERTEHRDYHLIYVNGPVTLPKPTAGTRTLFPIEEALEAEMFGGTVGGV